MSTHIMLDIETLGLTPGKNPIIAIGMVVFYDGGWLNLDPQGMGNAGLFYTEINMEAQEQYGLVADPSTLQWWSKQSDYAKALVDRSYRRECQEVWAAFDQMNAFLRQYETPFIWANPSGFDNAFVHETHKLMFNGLNCWNHRQDACYRTLKLLRPDIPLVETPGAKHHAYYDALDQARHAQQLLHSIGMF